MILLSFVVSIAILFNSCNDPVSGVEPLPPPDTTSTIDEWDGPPILFKMRTKFEDYEPIERPVIIDNHIVQLLEDPSDKARMALVATIDEPGDSVHFEVNSEMGYLYRSMRADQLGRCTFWERDRLVSIDPKTKSVQEFIAPSEGNCYATETGSQFVTIEKTIGDEEGSVTLRKFNTSTLSFDSLFQLKVIKGPRQNMSFTYAQEVEVADANILTGVFTAYDPQTRTTPSYTFTYNLTADTLMWTKLFDMENDIANAAKNYATDSTIYAKSFGRIIAYDLRTGETKWQKDKPNADAEFWGTSPVMVGGGKVYAYADANGLFGLDAETGEVVYYDETVTGTVVRAETYGDRFVVLSLDGGTINLFDPVSGEYDLQFKSPEHSGGNRTFFLDNFSVDRDRGWVAAQDFEYTYVFDISGY